MRWQRPAVSSAAACSFRCDAVRHAHRVLGVEPRAVVVMGVEGTCVKLVLKARAELPEPAVRAECGEERRELLRARRSQRVVDVDAAHGREAHRARESWREPGVASGGRRGSALFSLLACIGYLSKFGRSYGALGTHLGEKP